MLRRLALLLFLVGSSCAVGMAGASDDYFRLARLSYLDGHVSFQHSGDVDWTAASINMPLQPGDRVYTGNEGRAEIEFDDGSVYRLAENTDVEILSLSEDLIQVRVLIGLSTLTVQSGVNFEVDTPAAAFNTLRKGVYRFDGVESGDTDAIVRKGLLEAANNQFTQQIESGDLLHVMPGDTAGPVLSRYEEKDGWDDWTDRRSADMLAYTSRQYIPDNVYMGVSDLDAYGHWVSVDNYGPAWVPYGVDLAWSPYWEGRWCYRPFWGWTWVSYEPWGWLPYHYGRWYHSASFGWCWLPGAAFSFNFWSPGLVRFYDGPGWVSWCPLGPHDYYNVNNYYFNRAYSYQLNNLRTLQTRGPGDLINRSAPGAFRTVTRDQFVSSSLGGRGQAMAVNQPWDRGKIVTDRLGIQPSAMSYAPAPNRTAARPSVEPTLPTVVRTNPSIRTGGQHPIARISNPAVSPVPVPRTEGRGEAGGGTVVGRGMTTPGRVQPANPTVTEPGRGQVSPGASPSSRGTSPSPGYTGRSTGRSQTTQPVPQQQDRANTPATNDTSRGRARENPRANPSMTQPAPVPPRNERAPAQERKPETDRAKPQSRPRNSGAESAGSNYSSPYRVETPNPTSTQGPRTVVIGGSQDSSSVSRTTQSWRVPEAPAYSAPGNFRGGGSAAPSNAQGRWTAPPPAYSRAPVYQAPPSVRGGSAGSGFTHSAPARSQSAPAGGGSRQKGR